MKLGRGGGQARGADAAHHARRGPPRAKSAQGPRHGSRPGGPIGWPGGEGLSDARRVARPFAPGGRSAPPSRPTSPRVTLRTEYLSACPHIMPTHAAAGLYWVVGIGTPPAVVEIVAMRASALIVRRGLVDSFSPPAASLFRAPPHPACRLEL
ncbi:unnamed protein product [Amoebophrya sp. A120]|nr:unnamed protein product [Amoebophrya sp. A120]|eukprot:GSA120T00023678001.1